MNLASLIDNLSLLAPAELNAVASGLEQKLGIKTARLCQAPALAPSVQAEVAQEQSEWSVKLNSAGLMKMQVIKAVRIGIPGLGIADAKALVEKAPVILLEGVDALKASKLREALVAVGASAEIF